MFKKQDVKKGGNISQILTVIVGIVIAIFGLLLAWFGFYPFQTPTNFFQGIFGIQLLSIGVAFAKGDISHEDLRNLRQLI